ncbi:MAG: hypothetical protein ACOY4K_12225 [Pseudomonadota bacterium]
MADPDPDLPSPRRRRVLLGAALVLTGAGVVLMAVGMTGMHSQAAAFAGLAVLAVGVILGVMSQKGL